MLGENAGAGLKNLLADFPQKKFGLRSENTASSRTFIKDFTNGS